MSRATTAKLEKNLKELNLNDEVNEDTNKIEKIRQLPVRHQQFIESFLKQGTVKDAYHKVYPEASVSTCYEQGSRLYKRYIWAFEALLEEVGLTPIYAAKRHKQLLYHRSAKVSLGALKLYYDVIGRTNKASNLKQTVNNLVIVKDREKGIFTVSADDGQIVD